MFLFPEDLKYKHGIGNPSNSAGQRNEAACDRPSGHTEILLLCAGPLAGNVFLSLLMKEL